MEIETIKFYSVSDKYGKFSNFALYPIKLKGKLGLLLNIISKLKSSAHENKIRKASTPIQAAQLGRSRKVKLRPD